MLRQGDGEKGMIARPFAVDLVRKNGIKDKVNLLVNDKFFKEELKKRMLDRFEFGWAD